MTDEAFLPLPGSHPKSMMEWNETTGCRWPVGDHPNILFCNEPAARGQQHQYCPAHMKLCYPKRPVTFQGNPKPFRR